MAVITSAFTMKGGEISGNSATLASSYSLGGGVYVNGTINDGTMFTMKGGEISGNSADDYGGGVHIVGGTFTMSGGEISGNTAALQGGGVSLKNNSDVMFVKQSGGTIYGSDADSTLKNTATAGDSYGHAVFADSTPAKKRNTTAGVGVTLDSTKDGTAGGWE